jgi:hypothetical protein
MIYDPRLGENDVDQSAIRWIKRVDTESMIHYILKNVITFN